MKEFIIKTDYSDEKCMKIAKFIDKNNLYCERRDVLVPFFVSLLFFLGSITCIILKKTSPLVIVILILSLIVIFVSINTRRKDLKFQFKTSKEEIKDSTITITNNSINYKNNIRDSLYDLKFMYNNIVAIENGEILYLICYHGKLKRCMCFWIERDLLKEEENNFLYTKLKKVYKSYNDYSNYILKK